MADPVPNPEVQALKIEILGFMQDLKSELAGFQSTVVGLAHDVDDSEKRLSDMKTTKADMWKQVNDLKNMVYGLRQEIQKDMTQLKQDLVKRAATVDLIWKLMVLILTGAVTVALFGG